MCDRGGPLADNDGRSPAVSFGAITGESSVSVPDNTPPSCQVSLRITLAAFNALRSLRSTKAIGVRSRL